MLVETSTPFEFGPAERRQRSFPIVLQHDENDCAAACLAMIAASHGARLRLPTLRRVIGVGADGASLFGVALAAEQVGFRTRGVALTLDDLAGIRLPAIVTQGAHFVVLYEVRARTVTVGDPKSGLRRLPLAQFAQEWSGAALLFNPTPALRELRPEARDWSHYRDLARPYAREALVVAALSSVLCLLNVGGPVLSQLLVDRVLLRGERQLLAFYVAGVVTVLVVGVLCGWLRRRLMAILSARLEVELGAQFMRHLLRLPATFFALRRTGDLTSRLVDVETVQRFFCDRGLEALLDAVMLAAYASAICWYDRGMGAVFVAGAALFFAGLRLVARRSRAAHAARLAHVTEAQSLLIESVRGIQTLKAFGAELRTRWRWEEKFTRAALAGARQAHVSNGLQAAMELLVKGVPLFVLLYGAVRYGAGTMTMGELFALSALIGLALGPLVGLAGVVNEAQQMLFGLERLADVLEERPEDEPTPYVPVTATSVRGAVAFHDVQFHYGDVDRPPVLRGVRAELAAGERVAIVGRSGSGKSTLVRLLNRLCDPSAGRVTLDGHDLRHYGLGELRRLVGYVGQDAALLGGTILENIALGDGEPDLERAVAAARLAGADAFVGELPGGYGHPLLESGAGLSGGQRQRLALARALYHDPRVLVLDEVTSALDAATERAIVQSLPAMAQGRTVVVVTHRLALAQACDRLLVMRRGRIVAEGTPAVLAPTQDAFAALIEAGEEEEED